MSLTDFTEAWHDRQRLIRIEEVLMSPHGALSQLTRLGEHIMSALDDLKSAVTADVQGRKELAVSVSEIAGAVISVATFLTNNPAPTPDQLAALTTQLQSAGTDLSTAASTLHSSAVTLEGLVPAPPVVQDQPNPTGTPIVAPPVIGQTLSLPSDPNNPASATALHTVTAVNPDGSVTAVPVGGGPAVIVTPATVTPA